jgi:NADH-quinone oxidoreductase subunit N
MSILLAQSLKPFLAEIIIFIGAIIILIKGTFNSTKTEENCINISYIVAIFSLIFATFFIFDNLHKNFLGTTQNIITKVTQETPNITAKFSPEVISLAIKNTSASNIIKIITAILTAVLILNNRRFLKEINKNHSEFLSLILIAVVGGFIMISAQDFLIFYLGLELQTLSLYLLAAINKKSNQPQLQNNKEVIENQMASEAGIKYFILGSVASAMLLFGISLIYGYSGTINFNMLIANKLNIFHSAGLLTGWVFILTAMFFKVAAAPFYMWSPDVYQGSNTTTTNFFASIVKVFVVFATLKIATIIFYSWPEINQILLSIGVFSIIFGGFATIKQQNLKRFLAYSSIVHVGFILLAIGSIDNKISNITNIQQATIFYLVIYSLITFASFLIINSYQSNQHSQNFISINQLSGLAKKQPFTAFCFAVLMFSNAGIPPLAGFFAKFLVITTLIEQKLTIIAIIATVFTAVSAFYYLRIVKSCYFGEANEETVSFSFSLANKITLFIIISINILLIFDFDYLYLLVSKLLQNQ